MKNIILCSGKHRFHTDKEGCPSSAPLDEITWREVLTQAVTPIHKFKKERGNWIISGNGLSFNNANQVRYLMEDK